MAALSISLLREHTNFVLTSSGKGSAEILAYEAHQLKQLDLIEIEIIFKRQKNSHLVMFYFCNYR